MLATGAPGDGGESPVDGSVSRRAFLKTAAGVVLTAILVAAIGVFSSLDVLRNKPLATLRAE